MDATAMMTRLAEVIDGQRWDVLSQLLHEDDGLLADMAEVWTDVASASPVR